MAHIKLTEADKSKISDLTNNIESPKALREDLENKVKEALIKLSDKDEQIITEKKISKTARAQVALLNQQIKKLRQQIALIAKTLDASEEIAKKQRLRIANLGKRLNAALASKVQELSRYRSEFFGKLRESPCNKPLYPLIYPIISIGSFLNGKIPQTLINDFTLSSENHFMPST